MTRLTPIEKLARAICWAELSPKGQRGKTEVSYWRQISQGTRDELIREAKRWVWVSQNVSADAINDANDTSEAERPAKEE